MKKYAVLISVLLAACSDGGGEYNPGYSHGVAGVPVGSLAPRPPVTSGVATSNSEITNMASEIVVSSTSNDPVSVVRAVSTQNGDVTFTSYRLDDVKLFTAENLDNDARSYISLELNQDTGEINAVKMVAGDANGGPVGRDENDTTVFQGPVFEYVPDGTDRAVFGVADKGQTVDDLNALAEQNNLSGGHWNRIDGRMVFGTNGKDLDLQYSDFGHFNPIYRSKNEELSTDEQIIAARSGNLHRDGLDTYRTDEEFNALLAKEDYQMFAGGYAISGTEMLDTLSPANNTEYKGKAVGRVHASIKSGEDVDRAPYLAAWNVPDGQDGRDMNKAYATSEATMTIGPDGTQTLVMPFNTASDTDDIFYDMTITKGTDGAVNVEFAGTPSDAQYRKNDTEPGQETVEFTPGYYGVNNPIEAAGTARYHTEQDISVGDDTGVTREWEFQAAYGMKRQ